MLGNLFGNLKELPKPLGKYIVGIMQLDFTDRSRTKVFPFEEDNAHRKIPITIFYPAESNSGKDSAPYSSPELLEVLSKMTLGLFSKNVAKVKTNCYENVPIAVNKDKYPVIIFNHGYGSYMMQSTVLCSDLASSGYVVVSIGHPYESSGIKYLDGNVIKMPEIIQKNVRISSLIETYKHLRKILKASTKEYYPDSQAMQLSEQFLENYQELNKNVKIWVDDSIFIREKYEFREIITNCHLKFFEKYLLKNQKIQLKDLKYDGFEFRQKLSNN